MFRRAKTFEKEKDKYTGMKGTLESQRITMEGAQSDLKVTKVLKSATVVMGETIKELGDVEGLMEEF